MGSLSHRGNTMGASEMMYEDVPFTKKKTKVSTKGSRKLALQDVDRLGTPTIVWMLLTRHRVGLLFNIVLFENTYLVCRYLGVI